MASDGVTLDVVRTTVGEIPGAESSVDIAYDENGDRVWYSYSGTGQDRGFTEITVPGVGVYRADRVDGADGEFRLVRMDLVAGGYRDAGGSVHFPVKDAQGNVRGYASSAGLESAYDYYPYGTAVELSANGADDRRRWQGKEFDGEHGKYYFGARYFDPFFALWASPDPAGQFANPYSYGGDPVNYVDPSGEIVIAAILAGAAVGAVIGGGTAVYQCNVHGQGDCSGSYVATSAVVGAAAGAAGGLAAGAVSASGIGASIVGSTGLASHSGFWAAFAGGAIEGGFSGAAAGYANYSMKVLMGQTDGWDWKELAKSTLVGMGMGAPIGGLSSGIAYGLSEKFQWTTHEKVMKRALDKYDPITNEGTEYMEDAARYVYNVEGGTPDKTLSFQMQEIGKGQSHYSYRDNTIYLDDADIKTPSKLYSTVAHEMRHKPLWEKTGSIGDWQIEKSFNRGKSANALVTQELIINRELLSHKYFEFWDQSQQLNIRTNYLRYMDFRDARFDLLY